MLRIALKSLLHDRSRLAAALAGVAFAALLATSQDGLNEGFKYTSSSIVSRLGGDVWVTAEGVQVIDNLEPLSPGTHARVTAHPCVEAARPLIFAFSWVRTAQGVRENLRIVGTDLGEPFMPWELSAGLPSDLAAPMRIAVDGMDLGRLGLSGDPLGQRLTIRNYITFVGALAQRARSFALLPYVFAKTADARLLSGMHDEEVSAWILDLEDPRCADSVIAGIERDPNLRARRTDQLRADTETFWMKMSGAGAILGFSAIMGLLVGGVIVGQTLYSTVTEHERELAALRAMGATPLEVVGFIAFQAAALLVTGSAIGMSIALVVQEVALDNGIEMHLSAHVLARSAVVMLVMGVLASLLSVRRVLQIDPARVFR